MHTFAYFSSKSVTVSVDEGHMSDAQLVIDAPGEMIVIGLTDTQIGEIEEAIKRYRKAKENAASVRAPAAQAQLAEEQSGRTPLSVYDTTSWTAGEAQRR